MPPKLVRFSQIAPGRIVLPLDRQLGLGVAEGCLVDQEVGAAGQLHRRLAEHRVGAVHQAAARLRRAAQGLAADDATVVEGDAAACLELGVDRAGGDAQRPGLFHIEAARPGFALHPIAVGRHPVGERGAEHRDVVVVDQHGAALGRLLHPVNP